SSDVCSSDLHRMASARQASSFLRRTLYKACTNAHGPNRRRVKELHRMPELPEVETVRRGLAPWVEDATILSVRLNRPDLRFPFPEGLAAALEGRVVTAVRRRAKYLLMDLSDGRTLLSHLGMTGSWRFAEHPIDKPPRYYEPGTEPRHDHLIWELSHPRHGRSHLIYADPRRFGFIDLYDDVSTS